MIFGFNTDVKYGDTVYHIQSEARERDLLLQTQVFVRGRCIGKRATSYADKVAQQEFSEQQMHELLKAQHRLVLAAAREGRVEEMVSHEGGVQDVDVKGLVLKWVNADSMYENHTMVMRFQVTDSGRAVEGAKLTSRLAISNDAPIYSQAVTDHSGTAEIKVFLDEAALREAAVLVQAAYGEKSATCKFHLRKAGS